MDTIKKKLWGGYVLNDPLNDTDDVVASNVDYDLNKIPQTMLSSIKDLKSEFYTDEGTVDYNAMRESVKYAEYKKLTTQLTGFNPLLLKDKNERLAFWIDLYNTIVIDAIIALGVKESIKEVSGFFSRVKYNVGGELFSPDDIEHGILRGNARHPMSPFKPFGPLDKRRGLILNKSDIDPRIHFALVCGSRSCAPIKFYTPEGIDTELEWAATGFINSPEVSVIPEEKKLVMSKILKWYEADFGGTNGVIEFIIKYLTDENKKEFLRSAGRNLKIEYLEYDWNLNG